MIADVDILLKDLLTREMPIRKGEVDVVFDMPKREWSTQLNKPTLNLYLFDIKENVELRGSEQQIAEKQDDGSMIIRRNAVRIDLIYLLTCWTRDVQDQHRLLSGALSALLRNPTIPLEALPDSLKSQPIPLRLKAAQAEIVSNITDLWSTLDNELRPGIRLTVTVSVEPFRPESRLPVKSVEVKYEQNPTRDRIEAAGGGEPPPSENSHQYHAIGGRIRSQKYSTALIKLILRETAQEISFSPDGEFKISWLQEGDYHLDILANGRIIKQQKIRVPSSNYEIDV